MKFRSFGVSWRRVGLPAAGRRNLCRESARCRRPEGRRPREIACAAVVGIEIVSIVLSQEELRVGDGVSGGLEWWAMEFRAYESCGMRAAI
jgi:hypothetical protein